MKSLRESFEEYYAPVEIPTRNKRGFKIGYKYIGPRYVWGEGNGETEKIRFKAVIFTCATALIYLCAALKYSPLNFAGIVQLLALLALAPFVFQIAGVIELFVCKNELTELNFHGIRGKLTIAPFLTGACLLFASMAGTFLSFINGYPADSVIVTIGYFGCGAIELSAAYIISRIKYRKIAKDN